MKKRILAAILAALTIAAVSVTAVGCGSALEDKISNDDGKVPLTSLGIGDQIEFGTYEQDNNTDNGTEPIKWVVAGYLGSDYTVLLSWYGLDAQPYNTKNKEITWENCTLRKWLNKEFYNAAFSEEEKIYVLETQLENPDSEYYKYGAGNTTSDKVWIFNEYDANNYISVTDMNGGQVETTAYAQSKDLRLIDSYWFRTTGDPLGYPVGLVAYDTSHFGETYSNMDTPQAVRPVIVLPRNDNVRVVSCQMNVLDNPSAELVHYDEAYSPKIGMTKQEVLDSTWGEPTKKNVDEYQWGREEQWVYGQGYIYFENGIVTAIQHR